MSEEISERSISERYRDIAPLNEKHGVFLVRSGSSDRMCVKKILKTYNLEVYERLGNANIKGLPEIEIRDIAVKLCDILSDSYCHRCGGNGD